MKYTKTEGIQESFAEKMIAELLMDYQIYFEQEVSFDDCINPITMCKLRFDFYIPNLNTLIEYDGKEFHQSKEVKYRDGLKNKYAKDKGIRLIRVQGISNISKLPKKLGLKKIKLEPKSKPEKFINERIRNTIDNSNKIKKRIQANNARKAKAIKAAKQNNKI